MSVMVDYTRRIPPAALKLVGAIAVSRYLAPLPNPKVILSNEYHELVNAGIDVTLNWEFDQFDWKGGQGAGLNHAFAAVAQARALGYPKGSVIVGSADFDMTRVQWDSAGQGYANGFSRGIRTGGFRPGVYGPWDVLQWVKDAGYMDAFWQAGMSTDWSNFRNRRPWSGAHFRQVRQGYVNGVQVDYSDILIQPLWASKENEMTLYMAAVNDPSNNETKWYVGDKIWYRPVLNWPEHGELLSIGVVEKTFTVNDDWQSYVGRAEAL